jgi:hypothetical protein
LNAPEEIMPASHLLKCLIALGIAITPIAVSAQTPSTNGEIIRLIEADMPESIIIAKVNELRAGLDKSTDALIALRSAGATDLVLAAILSDKSIAVVSPVQVGPVKPSINFQNAEIAFESLLISSDMIRVNVTIHNKSEKPIYLWNSSDRGRDCMAISLTDELGNDFKCALDPFWSIYPYSRGSGGKTIMPDATVSFQYGFTRTGMTAGKSFNFSTSPFLTIAKGDPEVASKQFDRNEYYNYENLGTSFTDLPAKVRPAGK